MSRIFWHVALLAPLLSVTEASFAAGLVSQIPFDCNRQTDNIGAVANGSLSCSGAREKLVGGGCYSAASSNLLYQSYPTDNTTWVCAWSAATATKTIDIICCSY